MSLDRNQSPALFLFVCFTEALRHRYATLNTALYTGVAQRKRAVKTPSSTLLPLVVRLEDGYGSHPRGRRIETYHRYLHFFLHLILHPFLLFSFSHFLIKKIFYSFHTLASLASYTRFARSFHFDTLRLFIPSSYLFACHHVIHHSFR